MFNKIAPFIAAALVLSGAMKQSLAAPASDIITARKEDASLNVQVCTNVGATQCVTIPIGSDDCINFTGGLSFLNKEVSAAIIPAGNICTFFEQSGCESAQGGMDVIFLQGGTWDFESVPGTKKTVNFNDLASSFSCSQV